MKEFRLFGYSLKVNDDLEKYNVYRVKYIKLIELAQIEMDKVIENSSGIQELIEGYIKISTKFILNSIDMNIKNLYQLGINDVDRDIFIDKYCNKYFNYNIYLTDLEEEYIKIRQTSNELKQYREMKKNSRAKWQGGGFGVKGAIKGAATASVLNAGSSFLHSFGDVTESMRDSNKITNMLKSLEQEYKSNGKLKEGINKCILGCLCGFIDELIINKKITSVNISEKEALALYKNTIEYEKNSDKIIQNMLNCIIKYPYNIKPYEMLYSINSKDEGLLTLIKFFGIESIFKSYKDTYDKIDLDKRTFNGVIYDTMEEKIAFESEYKSKILEAVKILNSQIDNDIDIKNVNKNMYDKYLKIINTLNENYKINILKDIDLMNIKFNSENYNQFKTVQDVKKYIYEFKNIEENYQKYKSIKDNDLKIEKGEYLSYDDADNPMSLTGIIITIGIGFGVYKFMDKGMIRTILVGFILLVAVSNLFCLISNNIKKKLKLSQLKRDYENYKDK